MSLDARGKFNVLECVSRTITRVCRSSVAAETRGLGLQVDSVQFDGILLSGNLEKKGTIVQETTLETKCDGVVQDNRDGRSRRQ